MTDIIHQSILNKISKDKFLLVLDLPPILKSFNAKSSRSNDLVNLDKLQFSVAGTIVPAISIPAESLGVWGQTYKVSSFTRPPYNPITVSFTVDNNFDNYWVLWKWLNILNDRREGGANEKLAEFKTPVVQDLKISPTSISNNKFKEIKAANPYTDYQTMITIYGLREYNERVVKFDYYNSFITNLGELKWDYRDPEQMENAFTFEFSQMDISLIDI